MPHFTTPAEEPLDAPRWEKISVGVKTAGVATSSSPATGNLIDMANRLLVVSPYVDREHLLDLDTLDTENALLARALVHMNNLRADYATASYTESFNWVEVMTNLAELARQIGHRWRETSFYIVAFRSQIPPTTLVEDLGALDKAAHAEATASGGFLK
jgi:hypothetical protein